MGEGTETSKGGKFYLVMMTTYTRLPSVPPSSDIVGSPVLLVRSYKTLFNILHFHCVQIKKAAQKRKEEDVDFEEKRMVLGITAEEDEDENDKDNLTRRREMMRGRLEKEPMFSEEEEMRHRRGGDVVSRWRDKRDTSPVRVSSKTLEIIKYVSTFSPYYWHTVQWFSFQFCCLQYKEIEKDHFVLVFFLSIFTCPGQRLSLYSFLLINYLRRKKTKKVSNLHSSECCL